MDLATLRQILSRASGVSLACVGDVMVDRYVYGEVGRISPEAPIPVMARAREAVMLGAAGNVARNVAALGARAMLAGVVGADAAAEEAEALIAEEAGVEGDLVVEHGRATTVKTRFVAQGQQLLRVDDEQDQALRPATEKKTIFSRMLRFWLTMSPIHQLFSDARRFPLTVPSP